MSLSSTSNSISYTVSGSTTTFEFNLPYFDRTDLSVEYTNSSGALSTLTYATSPSGSTQYKVDATNGDTTQGATITLGAAITSGTIKIIREVPTTQEFNLQEGASIDPTAINKAFDRIVAQNQFMKNNFVTTWASDDDGAGTLTSSCKIATIGTGTAKVVVKTGILTLADNTSTQAATFPTAFGTSHVVTLLTPITAGSGSSDSVRVSAISTTGFSVVRKASGGTPTLYFLSLGN